MSFSKRLVGQDVSGRHFRSRFGAMGMISAALLGISLLAGGCQSKMYDQNLALKKQNQELQQQNTDLRSSQGQTQAQLNAQEQRLRDLEKNLNDTHAQQASNVTAPIAPAEPARSPSPAMDLGIQVHQDKAAGTLTMDLPGDVLFDSGRAMLNASAKVTLDKVVTEIKRDFATKVIRVDGHTDSDPIMQSHWANNMELSKARANAVAKYLESQGVPASHIQVHGYGDTKPLGADKRANRRVEVIVMTRENAGSARSTGGASAMENK